MSKPPRPKSAAPFSCLLAVMNSRPPASAWCRSGWLFAVNRRIMRAATNSNLSLTDIHCSRTRDTPALIRHRICLFYRLARRFVCKRSVRMTTATRMHSVRAPGPLKTRKLGALGVRTLCIAKDNERARATTLHVQDGDRLKNVVPRSAIVVSNVRTFSIRTPFPTAGAYGPAAPDPHAQHGRDWRAAGLWTSAFGGP